jgi:hypothetical protein
MRSSTEIVRAPLSPLADNRWCTAAVLGFLPSLILLLPRLAVHDTEEIILRLSFVHALNELRI